MTNYILFAHHSPTAGRDVWLIQDRFTGATVFRSASIQQARAMMLKLEAQE